MTLPGQATPKGTQRYRTRHKKNCAKGHFRKAGNLWTSSIGIGTYLGPPDEDTNELVTSAITTSINRGINLIDTAINYRFMQAEKCIGRVIKNLVESRRTSRDELVVCTKGGYIPHVNPVGWFKSQYQTKDLHIAMDHVVADCHCLHPDYLSDQLERSLSNLGLDRIDVYYLHNPEFQLRHVESEVFWERLRQAFLVLEKAAKAGKIQYYGLATWNAFRTLPHHHEYINLYKAKALAQKAAKGKADHFRFVQFPFNLAIPDALLANQEIDNETVPILEAARRLDIHVVTSASLCQGKILKQISDQLIALPGPSLTPAQQALQFSRSLPGVSAALVGMKTPEHIEENLQLLSHPPLEPSVFIQLLTSSGRSSSP